MVCIITLKEAKEKNVKLQSHSYNECWLVANCLIDQMCSGTLRENVFFLLKKIYLENQQSKRGNLHHSYFIRFLWSCSTDQRHPVQLGPWTPKRPPHGEQLRCWGCDPLWMQPRLHSGGIERHRMSDSPQRSGPVEQLHTQLRRSEKWLKRIFFFFINLPTHYDDFKRGSQVTLPVLRVLVLLQFHVEGTLPIELAPSCRQAFLSLTSTASTVCGRLLFLRDQESRCVHSSSIQRRKPGLDTDQTEYSILQSCFFSELSRTFNGFFVGLKPIE